MPEDHIEWTALEFTEHERSSDWYWILGIITVIGALLSILLGNFLFGIFILIGGIVIGIFASKRPDTLYCAIDGRGIYVNEEMYPYKSIESFWVSDRDPENPKLLLKLDRVFSFHVIIPLGDEVDPDIIADTLGEFIEEEEQDEGPAERIMEWLKF
jgi:hypothetical protein